jgi:AcrR family transcriptional regulator
MSTRETPRGGRLWGEDEPGTRGPKPGLTTARIAEAAIAIADAEGLGAVSMQRVAKAFGFTTMSLYRYLPGKAELVALMFDTAMGPPPDLAAYDGWRDKLRAWADGVSGLLHQRPWGLEVLNRLRLTGPNELAWMEAALASLAGTGLAPGEALDAIFAVTGHVRVAAQYSARQPDGAGGIGPEAWNAAIADVVRRRAEAFPALAEAVAAGVFDESGDPRSPGVELILDGIAARIAAAAPACGTP